MVVISCGALGHLLTQCPPSPRPEQLEARLGPGCDSSG